MIKIILYWITLYEINEKNVLQDCAEINVFRELPELLIKILQLNRTNYMVR